MHIFHRILRTKKPLGPNATDGGGVSYASAITLREAPRTQPPENKMADFHGAR